MGCNEDDSDGEETMPAFKYGWLRFQPRSLQCFNKIQWLVFWMCVFTFLEGFTVNGVVNVILPALEKRYSLSSATVGVVSSCNDFGTVVVVLFVGYYGGPRHKPRLMAIGYLLMALGCLVFCLPHFIGDRYRYVLSATDGSSNICTKGDNSTCAAADFDVKIDNSDLYLALFIVGNMLLGIGATPTFSIGEINIDENCEQRMFSFYISLMHFWLAVGVAIGYIAGGQILNLFVDFNRVDSSSVPLTPTDPQWVGPWWLGMLIGMAGFFLVALPMSGFPRRLPIEESNVCVFNSGGDHGELAVGGMGAFGPKIIQTKFNTDLATAGTIMGIVTVPGAGGGMLLGGYLVKRFSLSCRGILRLCAVFSLLSLLLLPHLLAQCQEYQLAGVISPYNGSSEVGGVVHDCNNNCGCNTEGFEPVCAGSTVYFSPCHAGCSGKRNGTEKDVYFSCSCLNGYEKSDNITGINNVTSAEATSGLCSGQCVWMYIYCVCFVLTMITTFATLAPSITATVRCVPEKQRSLAISANQMFVRLVGTIPGPVVMGAIIDSTCLLWQDTCGTRGSCWVYDKYDMGVRILLWLLVLKASACALYVIGSCVYKPPSDDRNVELTIPDTLTGKNRTIENSTHL